MGSSGSYLKAKADALRIHHRSREDKQALDLQHQIQAQEDEIATLDTTYRSIKLILYNNSPFSLMLSDFKLSEGVVWLVSPPSKLQPGDCGVFGAFVKDPSTWDEAMPLRGQLVYDGVLPTVHFLTKHEQKKARKEEAKRRKSSKKSAQQDLAHEAKVQQLKEKQAFRKREKSSKNAESRTSAEDHSDDLSHSTAESTNEMPHDGSSMRSETLSESNPITPRSQKSDPSAPGLRTSWDKKSKRSSDKKSRRKSDRPPRTTRRAPSNPSLRSQDDSTVSTHASSSAAATSLDPTVVETLVVPANEDSEEPVSPATTPREGSFTSTNGDYSTSPRSENAPSSGNRRMRHLPSMLARMVRPKEGEDDERMGWESPTTTPRGGQDDTHSSPPTSYRSLSSNGANATTSMPTTPTSGAVASTANPSTADNGPHTTTTTTSTPSGNPPSSLRSSRRRSSSGQRHVHMSEQLEQAIPDSHRSSVDSAGTARSSNKDVPQLFVQWSVGANGSDFEDRCSLITVAFNELMEHKDGHGALLIEVQERASPASSESLDEPTRERTSNIPGEDLAAAKFTQGVVEDVPVREEDTATTTTNNTTSSSTVASANHPHLPHDPQSQALDSSPNAQFQPLRKVQRAMSAAYLRSAATLKKADVEELEEMSYFDAEEIRELHILFSKVAGYTSHITPESFSAFLPELSDPQLRRAVFAGFDKSRTFDQKISFDEFVLSLSSMCRGTLEERAVVVFNMCSSSQASQVTATVSREQVLAVVSRIAAAMEQAGFTPRDYGNPIQVVNNVFLKSGEAPKNDRAAGPRRMREKIAHLAKGLAHHHRDESITNRGQAEAYSRERYELDDDDESSSIDDSQGSTDSDSDVPDGPNVAAPSSPHNERVLPHRKMSRLTFYRKDTSKAEKPAKPPKPESSAIPPASHMSILEDTSSAPTTPSTTPTPKGAHSVENSQASDIPASPSNKATLQHAANASSAQPHGASLSTSDDDSSPVSVANKSPEKPETTSKSIDLLQPEDAIKEAKEQIEPPLIHSKSSSSSKKVRDEDVTESSSSRLKRVMFDASSSAESDGGLGEGSRSDSDKEETSMPPRKAKTALSPAGLKPSLRPAPHPSGSPVPSRRAGAQHKVVSVARYEDGLTKKQFKVRCRNEPDLPECFGLFDFFNSAVVEPVAKTSAERSIWHRVSVSGFMGKERGSMSRKIGKVKDKRHFVLKDGFLGYSKKPGGPLLRAIAIQEASIKPHISEKKFALTVIAPYFHRKLFLQSAQEAQIWVHAMRSMIKGKNRFKSFALPRKNIAVRPFMNGKEYFDALVPALLKCKRRLYISGWYLSPGLLLKRGAMGAIDRFRLDNLILEAANRGVSIFIIIYNAPSFSDFDLQPSYVCNFFNNLHPNIHALMHPNYYVPSMWSHHQKLVVCDESLAFIGGIDLCYGRYEDSDYNITDPEETNFPGRDYCNVFLENESNGPSEQALIDRTVQPRMPWSDVQVQLSGMAAFDVGLNFLHRWNHILREGTYECKPLPFLFPSHSVFDEEQKIGTIDASTGQPFPTVPVQETPAMETRRLRSSSRGTNGAPSPANSAPNSSRAPTSPTSASSAATTGPTDTNAVPLNKDEPIVPPDMLPQDIMPPEEAEDVLSGGLPDDMIAIPELPWDSRVPIENISLPAEDLGYHGCTVQIVRSVCGWSAGTSAPEQSIYKAYLSLIRESQHFIFIQNQYFISSIETSSPKNRIAEAIYLRLREAIEQKQVFRVLVLIPVLPGGGAIEAASTRYMLKYTNRTISRGGNSILEKLQQDFPDVDVHEYIRFGTPRQIGRLGDTLLSEPVYIHSKVMIVDDRRAIIGSANINDRSLRGTRDSEVACVIEPGTKESTSKSTFNGHSVEVCKAVQSLRVRMFADMIGTKVHSNKPEDIETMMNLQDAHTAVDLLMRRAELNTKAYLRVFPGMIPNVIYKISDFKRARVDVGPKEDPVVRDQRFEDMSLIRGIITSWPYDFLKEEPMGISLFEKEYVVPRIVFL